MPWFYWFPNTNAEISFAKNTQSVFLLICHQIAKMDISLIITMSEETPHWIKHRASTFWDSFRIPPSRVHSRVCLSMIAFVSLLQWWFWNCSSFFLLWLPLSCCQAGSTTCSSVFTRHMIPVSPALTTLFLGPHLLLIICGPWRGDWPLSFSILWRYFPKGQSISRVPLRRFWSLLGTDRAELNTG